MSISEAEARAHIQAAAEAAAKNTEAAATTPDASEESPPPEEPEAIVEHPLHTAWSFWYDKKPARRCDWSNYAANLNLIGTFSTVEGFWRQYLYLQRPSALPRDTNIFCFRAGDGMLPMWETFPNGGCWILKLKKRSGLLGQMWQDLLFAAIGEAFGEPDVVGVTMAIRTKEDLLSVWNADNSTSERRRFEIGEKLKLILNLDPNTLVQYKDHARSISDSSTFRNAKPYVFAAAS
mmetsp:Transcript_16213/g.32347  ORF Transcript_16213/g.32347 Transcript_16213/m.32347 type:complete len:235 (-) Transcript_16213:18-722(-)